MLHKRILGGALVIALLATSACSTGDFDAWKNPPPTTPPVTEACQAPTVGDTYGHPKGGDPDAYKVHDSSFTPGYDWVKILVSVVAIQKNGPDSVGNRLCLPVNVHIEAIAIDPGTELLGCSGEAVAVEEFSTSTPLEDHCVSFQYDPNDPAFAEFPPQYKVTVTAFYDEDRDEFYDRDSGHSIGCVIKFEGGSVAHSVVPLAEHHGVFCEFQSNRYRKA